MPGHLAPGRGRHQLPEGEVPLPGAHAAVGELDVVRLALEQVRRERPQLLPQLAGRLNDGVAGHVELPGRRRRPGERRQGGVADVDHDVRRVDAEHLARELDERRGLAAADVGDADPYDECPVELEADPGACPVVEPDAAAVGLEVARDAAPDAPSGRRRLRSGPERRLDAVGELRQRDVRVEGLPHRESVAALDEVAAPQLERIEPQLGREQVHLPLVAERDLHAAEAAHRARGRVVRVGDAGVDAHVGAAVRPLRAGRRIEEDERRQERIGAAVGDDLDVLRE